MHLFHLLPDDGRKLRLAEIACIALMAFGVACLGSCFQRARLVRRDGVSDISTLRTVPDECHVGCLPTWHLLRNFRPAATSVSAGAMGSAHVRTTS